MLVYILKYESESLLRSLAGDALSVSHCSLDNLSMIEFLVQSY